MIGNKHYHLIKMFSQNIQAQFLVGDVSVGPTSFDQLTIKAIKAIFDQ